MSHKWCTTNSKYILQGSGRMGGLGERERGEMRASQLIAFIRFLEGPPLSCA